MGILQILQITAKAQTTIVTATVSNPSDAQAFANGTVNAIFTPPTGISHQQEYLINGAQFPYFVSGTLDATGTFTITLTDDHKVAPFGGRWLFIVCSAANIPCLNTVQDVFGATINLSTQISNEPTAPVFKANMLIVPRTYQTTETYTPSYQNAPTAKGAGLVYMINDGSLNYTDETGTFHKLCTNDGFITGCTGGGGGDTDYYQHIQYETNAMPQEITLNFHGANGLTVVCADDVPNTRTTCTFTAPTFPTDTDFYQFVQANTGSLLTQEPRLNLIGSGVTVACVDNPGNTSTDCTITGAGTGPQPYDISGTIIGGPDAGLVIQRFPAPRTLNISTNCGTSKGVLGTAPLNTAAFSLQKNGTQFGTMTFASSATTATFSCVATTFNVGDVFTLVSPNPADANLADLGWSFTFTR